MWLMANSATGSGDDPDWAPRLPFLFLFLLRAQRVKWRHHNLQESSVSKGGGALPPFASKRKRPEARLGRGGGAMPFFLPSGAWFPCQRNPAATRAAAKYATPPGADQSYSYPASQRWSLEDR